MWPLYYIARALVFDEYQFFAAVCSDDTFWKRKLESDFNFSSAGTARASGWKFIYRGLFNPRGDCENFHIFPAQ